MHRANPNATLAAGLFLVGMTLAAYLYAAGHGIDFGPAWAVVGPAVAALFAAPALSRIERKTDQAVENTNGALNGPLAELVAKVDELAGKVDGQAGRDSSGTGNG